MHIVNLFEMKMNRQSFTLTTRKHKDNTWLPYRARAMICSIIWISKRWVYLRIFQSRTFLFRATVMEMECDTSMTTTRHRDGHEFGQFIGYFPIVVKLYSYKILLERYLKLKIYSKHFEEYDDQVLLKSRSKNAQYNQKLQFTKLTSKLSVDHPLSDAPPSDPTSATRANIVWLRRTSRWTTVRFRIGWNWTR